MEKIVQKMRDSKALRWSVLGMVSLSMMSGYIISDIVAPLKTLLEQAPTLWNSTDYGVFTSGYGWLNIFLLMLIFSGMILDRMGIRFTGTLAMLVMIAGTAIKYWALSTTFATPMIDLPFGWQFNRQVLYAALGFAVFGTGVEMIGITANKAIVKWFRGKEMALAIGMNTAFGRIGTLIALSLTPKIAIHFGSVSAPILMGLGILCLGLCTFLVYNIMDRRLDRQDSAAGVEAEEPFRFRDIGRIASNSGFWLITALCVLFYSAVFPYLKYAPDFMFQKFGIPLDRAGEIPSL
ncbi:MAG: MFS transporter, partial [Rikenellaceae bacterium]|nr:MFS transporter [Rikenellaceae bacterium]